MMDGKVKRELEDIKRSAERADGDAYQQATHALWLIARLCEVLLEEGDGR